MARRQLLVGPEAALRLGGAHVGGKAAALARLSAAGERVPEWMVLPADVLESHLVAAGAMSRVRHALDALAVAPGDAAAPSRAARALGQIIDELLFDVGLLDALDDVAATLGGGPFAVRSSAIGEDGERCSFAGQLESVLNVDGRAEALADAVRRCWRSAFGVRVLDYRRRHGALGDATRIAVIVQRLIPGDISGVLFTVDPITGVRDRMRVSACAGLGEGLVSGAVDADEYVVSREGVVLETSAAGPDAGASIHESLDEAVVQCSAADSRPGSLTSGSARSLSRDALTALAELGRRIESREGGPRDIEWTMRDGVLWVLQARPVTSPLEPEAQLLEHRIVWDNSNIQESYCGVTTPLTFSFARDAYASVYEQTMRAVGVPAATIAAHRPMLDNLLGLLHGRVYYNLNSWYRGLLLLPGFRRNKADMERMMGVEEPVDFVADEQAGVVDRLRRLPRLARTLVGLQRAFATLDRDTIAFLETFATHIRAVDRSTLGQRSLGELMTILDGLRRDCIEQWVTPIVNDFRVMMVTGRLRRLVERAMPGNAEQVMQTLLGGADVAVSAGPAMAMLDLASLARRERSVASALHDLPPEAALQSARRASPEFSARLDALLEEYGDRCMGELKLESQSLRDDPAFIVRVLRNYIDGRVADPAALADTARAVRLEAERAVEAGLGAIARVRFRRVLAVARRSIRARESMRLARTRLFGTHRDVYRAIGARLRDGGHLERAEDVLYLTTREIADFWNGTAASADLAATVGARRAEFSRYEGENPPNRIITTGVPHRPTGRRDVGGGRGSRPRELAEIGAPLSVTQDADNGRGRRVLRGLGCSAGIVEGVVRVVRTATDDLALDGHILVAPRTDPGWAPLFPCARGIIVERGSLLSHSAVLARELGIPAVVGIPGIVATLRDGERVRIDGTAGTVERLEGPCAS
jgi:pyruvate,water dikinase